MVSSASPHWRSGPEDKSVLCNACGLRYTKWGSIGLQNYFPNHFKPEYLDNLKNLEGRNNVLQGSSYATDSSNATSGKIHVMWNPYVPSRKRSRVVRMTTSIQRFHEQLLMMWKNEENSNDQSSQESEEVLLIDNVNNFIPCNEIGLGCILLKPEDASA
ncbi:hypothetical protein GmHk_05G013980 [Glycine max]|nr:hypothetical protein GmHk_05G013980 [Glycine max]